MDPNCQGMSKLSPSTVGKLFADFRKKTGLARGYEDSICRLAVRLVQEGATQVKVAEICGVRPPTVCSWVKKASKSETARPAARRLTVVPNENTPTNTEQESLVEGLKHCTTITMVLGNGNKIQMDANVLDARILRLFQEMEPC